MTVLDRDDVFVTAYLAPDRPAMITPIPWGTNHQHEVEWEEHAIATRSVERSRALEAGLREHHDDAAGFVRVFGRPPVHTSAYQSGFGTLYTAVYAPADGGAAYLWPGLAWEHSFDRFSEGDVVLSFDASGARAGLGAPGR